MNGMRKARFIVLVLLLALMGVTSAISAQDVRNGDDVIILTGVRNTSSCANINVNLYIYNDQPGFFEVRLQTGGETVTDFLLSTPLVSGSGYYTSTGYFNARGLAPIDRWPLVADKKVFVTLTLFDVNFEPTYQSVGVMANCAATTFKKLWHGPAYQLVQNSSFEAVAHTTEPAPDEALAAFWKGVNTVNDARVCDPVVRLRGGSSKYVGNCGYLFNADGVTKSKIVQNYIGTVGSAGDTVMLQGFVQSFTGYAGAGKFVAVLHFADGTTRKIQRDFRSGEHPHTYPNSYPYYITTVLPAPIVSAKIIVKQGFSAAQAAVDAVTLTVFSKNGGAPRAVPPAPDAPLIDIAAR